jgi:kynurenine formamidase
MRSLWLLVGLVALGMVVGCRSRPAAPPRPRAIVDLSPPLDGDTVMLQYGHKAAEFFGLRERDHAIPVRPENERRTFGFSYFELLSHGGAHLDASARLLRDGLRPADVPLDNLFGWARMVDLRWHDRSTEITVADLENYKIEADEIVLLNVGYVPPGPDDWPQYAFLSDAAAHWLAQIGVRAVATDMPSLGNLRQQADLMEKGRSAQEIWAAHVPFFQQDIPVIQSLVNLDALLGERRIYFAGFPLPLGDRSGAPMRAVALVYD